MTRRAICLLALVACGAPKAPPTFATDEAIGTFALDPSSPVIARSTDPTDPDYGGATAPTVWTDATGWHAAYLAIDANGNTSILGANSLDGRSWTKAGSALVASAPGLGRPAAVGGVRGVSIYYALSNGDGGSDVIGPSGAVAVPGGDQPCAVAAGGDIWIYALMGDGSIHAFESPDGEAFTDQGAALAVGPDGGFDSSSVGAPSAIVEESALGRSLFRLWYTGIDQPGGTPSIGLAGAFAAVGPFERYADNPVRFHGDVASVYAIDGGYAMLYSQTPFNAPTDISLATHP
jgi:hypothetical protein